MATLKNLTINDTGYIRIASGTTGERPGTPVTGMMRYNTTLNANEFFNGTTWVTIAEGIGSSSTGGTITQAGGYQIHTFTSGTDTFTPYRTGTVEVLTIAGGGGGTSIGGGGGAGGLIFVGGVPVTAGVGVPVTVGTGGKGSAYHSWTSPQPALVENAPGTPTTFGAITATGGGAGRGYYTPAPSTGGSGGGGPGYGSISQSYTPAGTGIAGQGTPGGYGCHYNGGPNGTHYGGGGGGGAGTPGYNRYGFACQARGGEGVASSISGSTVWYAGGGAGGAHSTGHGTASLGGKGGGGNNSNGNGYSPVLIGVTNTGGGGAGANHAPGYNSNPLGTYPYNDSSGAGGPGIVIVRFRN